MACAPCADCMKSSKVVDESAIVVRRRHSSIFINDDDNFAAVSSEFLYRNDDADSDRNITSISAGDLAESYIVQQALREEQAKLKSANHFDLIHVEERCFYLARTAALTGDKTTLKSLLMSDPWMLNAQDYLGRPLLTYATLADQGSIIKWLIKRGAEVDVKDTIQRTPLHWASHKGFHQIVKLFLDHRADCTILDADGVSPLHLAIKQSSTRCLQIMLDHLDRNKCKSETLIDAKRRSPVHWAAASGCTEHLTVLMKHKLKFDVNQGDIEMRTPLMWAAMNNDEDASLVCCKILTQRTPWTISAQDKSGFGPLHYAVSVNNVGVVRHMLEMTSCNVNVLDNCYRTPLHWACKLNSLEIVDLLIKENALLQTDGAGATPLHYAAQGNYVKLVDRLLLMCKRDLLDADGKSALMYAASAGANVVIETMLHTLYIDKDQKDFNGSTALHLAAQSGQTSTCQLLIRSGWSLEVMDNHGLTPLLSAAEAGHPQCVMILLKAGAFIGTKDKSGRSALHWSALGGHAYVCQLLVKQGLNPDFRDAGGRTPLHCAAFAGHHECISVLLQAGADAFAADNESYLSLQLAAEEGHQKSVKMLIEAGSTINAVCCIDGVQYTSMDLAQKNHRASVVEFLMSAGSGFMFGEKAVELIKELDRAGNILPPYNDENIREVLDEMKVLYNQNHLDVLATQSGAKGLYPTIQWRHCGIERNRRCILAYLYNRLMNIKEIRWEVGGVLPSGVKPSLSCKWFQSYNQILASYMRSIDGLVLTQDDKPPKSLFLEVRCLIDYGDFETEDGTQLFLKKGTVHFLPRGEAEQFIREGVVAHVSI